MALKLSAALLLLGFLAGCGSPQHAAVTATPITVDSTEDQIRQAVGTARMGQKLTPKVWPNGARVAVCLSFDVDNELLQRANPLPVPLSVGEYGATTSIPRILALLDHHQVPATFFIPAMGAMLHPEIVPSILSRQRHEIGVHGWIHEFWPGIGDAAKEERLLTQSIDYEIVSRGQPSGVIELPISEVDNDYVYYGETANGSLPSPDAVFQIYKAEFDLAFEERTLFILTQHPHVGGRRSRIVQLDRLITYIKSKPGVWFATMQQVASYVKPTASGH